MLPKLTRGTLAEQVTERLLEYIESQHMKAGELLPSETSLASSFGVSRPVIREALKNLEGQGVIEIVNGKGALVRPIDSHSLRLFFERAMQMEYGTILELMEVRKGIETQAAALAAHRRTDKDLERILQITEKMRSSMNDMETYTQLDVDFHMSIAAASHNALLVSLVESIRDALRKTIVASLQSSGMATHLANVQKSHELLYQKLLEMNEVEATQAMAMHFDEAIAALTDSHA